jgi:hypothetical protein
MEGEDTMEIEEAFTQEAIAAAGTDVASDEEIQVRQMVRRVCESQEPPVLLQHDAENVAVLCFVAGRAYEQQFANGTVMIAMSVDELPDYHQFLRERGQA